MKKSTVDLIYQGILNEDRVQLSKAITLCESQRKEHRDLARELLIKLDREERSGIKMAITGPPGAGKSSIIEKLGLYLISKGLKIAVLTIDPSSQYSQGSILGDQTRMEELSRNSNAYIRQSPTSNRLGGIAPHTREAILLCEKAGYDVILVETVGVGQSEFKVAQLVDLVAVLVQPASGDELQGVKRGIMEVGDLFVVNKTDGNQKSLAAITKKQVQNALHLMPTKYPDIKRPTILTSAIENNGLEELWNAAKEYLNQLQQSGSLATLRASNFKSWFIDLVKEQLLASLEDNRLYQRSIEEWQLSDLKDLYKRVDEITNQ